MADGAVGETEFLGGPPDASVAGEGFELPFSQGLQEQYENHT